MHCSHGSNIHTVALESQRAVCKHEPFGLPNVIENKKTRFVRARPDTLWCVNQFWEYTGYQSGAMTGRVCSLSVPQGRQQQLISLRRGVLHVAARKDGQGMEAGIPANPISCTGGLWPVARCINAKYCDHENSIFRRKKIRTNLCHLKHLGGVPP